MTGTLIKKIGYILPGSHIKRVFFEYIAKTSFTTFICTQNFTCTHMDLLILILLLITYPLVVPMLIYQTLQQYIYDIHYTYFECYRHSMRYNRWIKATSTARKYGSPARRYPTELKVQIRANEAVRDMKATWTILTMGRTWMATRALKALMRYWTSCSQRAGIITRGCDYRAGCWHHHPLLGMRAYQFTRMLLPSKRNGCRYNKNHFWEGVKSSGAEIRGSRQRRAPQMHGPHPSSAIHISSQIIVNLSAGITSTFLPQETRTRARYVWAHSQRAC